MTKLRIGLIGFGTWTRNAYLPALQYDGRAIVTAATAASEKTRKSIRDVVGSEVAIFDNYETLLNEAELDAVMIAVPDAYHQPALSAALKTGIPVLYEPPIANTRVEIASMIDTLLAAPQVTHADLELGLIPVVNYTANLLKNGEIGTLQSISVDLKAAWGPELPDLDVCMINRTSCWYVDVMNRITGFIPNRVLVLDGYGNSGRRQNTSTGIFDYNGIWGILKINVNSAEKLSINIEITCDNGEMQINLLTGELKIRTLQNPDWYIQSYPSLQPCADWPGMRESVSSFIDSVISGKPSPGNAKIVAQLNLIGLAAEYSKDSGTWAEIKKL